MGTVWLGVTYKYWQGRSLGLYRTIQSLDSSWGRYSCVFNARKVGLSVFSCSYGQRVHVMAICGLLGHNSDKNSQHYPH